MSESFDAFRYIGYLQSRWLGIAASVGIAAALALAISLAMPRQYTATARVLIEPPAGADPRSATAVSPVYLESLKTYENFAAGDSLFQKAAQRFGLSGGPIESLKLRVLKVQIVRNTRIMEISATLPDAAKAQAFARFLAESTVEMNRTTVSDSDRDLLHGLEQQANESRERLQAADIEWAKAISAEPVAGLEAATEQAAELRSKLEEQIQSAELEITDIAARAKAGEATSEMTKEDGNARARLIEIRRQLVDLERRSAEREKLLGIRQAHRDRLEAERKAGQAALLSIDARLRDARGESGFRGERLKIIDPGIVPERPSSPNLPLNIAIALLAGLVLPVLYLTLQMSFQERRASMARGNFRALGRARDE